ncbi:MAG TPA: hypothetical protein PLV72_01155 [Candidatus Magasanikbacteria bacterium]|nr:hypothetical protein [Candidatus Magasanikbacteria bacterium]
MKLFRGYIFPLIIGLFQSAAMISVLFVPSRSVFFSVNGAWLALLSLLHWHIAKVTRQRWPNELPLAFISYVGILGLMILAEDNFMRIFLTVLSGFTAGFLVYKAITKNLEESSVYRIIMKPSRRLSLILWTITVLASSISLFSAGIFFAQIPSWCLSLLIALVCGGAAIGVWRMYFNESGHKFMLWALLVGVGMFECAWVLMMLPLGYLVLGFVLSWVWYLSVLFVRFHFGPQGIVWRYQGWFILTNLILLVCLLIFFVRWI